MASQEEAAALPSLAQVCRSLGPGLPRASVFAPSTLFCQPPNTGTCNRRLHPRSRCPSRRLFKRAFARASRYRRRPRASEVVPRPVPRGAQVRGWGEGAGAAGLSLQPVGGGSPGPSGRLLPDPRAPALRDLLPRAAHAHDQQRCGRRHRPSALLPPPSGPIAPPPGRGGRSRAARTGTRRALSPRPPRAR